MGLKRPRSCNDHDEPLQDSKRKRRAASDSFPSNKNVLSQFDLTNPSCQVCDPENGRVQNDNEGDNLRDSHKVAGTSQIFCGAKAESRLSEISSTPISHWIENLPGTPTEFNIMSQAVFKRPRSESNPSLQSTDIDCSNETRRGGGDLYKNPRYDALIASKGAFLTGSYNGPLPEEVEFCNGLLSNDDVGVEKIELKDPIFDSKYLRHYIDLMQQSSELRLCIDLHARLVPSAEILSLLHGKTGDLQEGCNDRWLQAIEFIPKIPQPDRTVAFRASVFTDLERQKLGVQPGVRSLYAACEGMLFPFLTCEVKAGSEGLTTAKRANANSMAVALRGVVDLFRRVNMEQDIHRKILGITIAHNAATVELYGHYPEIDGEKTRFYQYRLRAFDYGDRDGQDCYTSYKFVRNIYTKFSKRHLGRLREAIAKLEIPSKLDANALPDAESKFLTPTASDLESASKPSEASSGRVPGLKAQIASLTQTIANLQKEMERQRLDYQQREDKLLKLLSNLSSGT